MNQRLAQLADLQPGWLGQDEGAALDRAGLTWLGEVLALAGEEGMPRAYLYPTLEGGAQAEWSFGDWEVQCEFDLVSKRGECLAVHVRRGASESKEIDFLAPGGASALARFVAQWASAPDLRAR